MAVKITTLIENSPGEHLALKTEHGISFFIEKDGHKLLFDTGQSGTFIENAEQLQVDLSTLEYVVLSHGHYDHSGGLRHLVDLTTNFELLVGKGFFIEKYGFKNGRYEFLGNNFDEKYLRGKNIAYRFIDQALTQILPGIYIVTNFPRKHADEVINPRFMILEDGEMKPDPFHDEVLVAIDTPKGLIVLLGCSHPGMKNMLDAAVSLIKRPLHAVLGGTHLVEANAVSLTNSLEYLNKNNDALEFIGVSHCTGPVAMEKLAASNQHYYHNRTGSALFVA